MVNSNPQKPTKSTPLSDGSKCPFTYKDELTFEWVESDYSGNQIYLMHPANHLKKLSKPRQECMPLSSGVVDSNRQVASSKNNSASQRIDALYRPDQTFVSDHINNDNDLDTSANVCDSGFNDADGQLFKAYHQMTVSSKALLRCSKISEKISSDKNFKFMHSMRDSADINLSKTASSLNYAVSINEKFINIDTDETEDKFNVSRQNSTGSRFKERLYTLTVDEIEHYKCTLYEHFKEFAVQCNIPFDALNCRPLKVSSERERIKGKSPTHAGDVFNLNPTECVKRFGLPLPPAIYKATQYISMKAYSSEGLFRKCGLRSRKNKLIDSIRQCPTDISSFREYSSYDVADIVKHYLVSVPGTVFTSDLLNTFCTLLTNTRIDQSLTCSEKSEPIIRTHADFTRVLLLCLPDEYREILQIILEMMKTISNHSDVNGMTIENLATCVAPSMFQLKFEYATLRNTVPEGRSNVKPHANISIPKLEGAKQCFIFLVKNVYQLFSIPFYYDFIWNKMSKKLTITQLGCSLDNPQSNYIIYMCTALATVYEQYVSKFQQWEAMETINSIPVSRMQPNDGIGVQVYRGYIEINESASNVMLYILHNMHIWNTDIHRYTVIESRNQSTDIIYYRYLFGPFFRDFTLLRSWKFYNQSEMGLIACTSVQLTPSGINNLSANDRLKELLRKSPNRHRFGIILASHYIIERKPRGCQVTHILRADLRGRNISYCDHLNPYLVSRQLNLLKDYCSNNKALTN